MVAIFEPARSFNRCAPSLKVDTQNTLRVVSYYLLTSLVLPYASTELVIDIVVAGRLSTIILMVCAQRLRQRGTISMQRTK